MNRVFFMGRLTRDPEITYRNYGDGDRPIARFSLAVDRRGDEKTDFFNCTAFGKQAEFAEKYLKKGAKILIMGSVQNDNYTNRNGEKVYSVQIMVNSVEFCESKRAAENTGSAAETQQGDFMDVGDMDDELPFA